MIFIVVTALLLTKIIHHSQYLFVLYALRLKGGKKREQKSGKITRGTQKQHQKKKAIDHEPPPNPLLPNHRSPFRGLYTIPFTGISHLVRNKIYWYTVCNIHAIFVLPCCFHSPITSLNGTDLGRGIPWCCNRLDDPS